MSIEDARKPIHDGWVDMCDRIEGEWGSGDPARVAADEIDITGLLDRLTLEVQAEMPCREIERLEFPTADPLIEGCETIWPAEPHLWCLVCTARAKLAEQKVTA